MFIRRTLLAGAAAAAVAPFASRAFAGPQSQQLDALYETFFHEGLRLNPEGATELGLDKGADADLAYKLGDVSTAGIETQKAASKSRLARLKAFDRKALTGLDAVNYDTVAQVEEDNLAILGFDFGGQDAFSPSPYVLSPLTGAYQRVPVFLDAKHRVEDKTGAEAYLSRLDAFATAIDQNTDRFRHDVGAGVVPPDFLLDTTLRQMQALITAPEASDLVKSLDRRAKAKGLGDGYGPQAAKLYADKIAPALARQIEAVKAARVHATHEAGVSRRFKEGAGFYAANLAGTTTTRLKPEEIHKIGLERAKAINARLEPLLQKQGLTKGTVGERIASLYNDKSQYYPNTDPGRAELIADLQKKLDDVRARLPQVFSHIPNYRIEVRRVPAAIDAGAPLAYSESPPPDGARPGYVYFNLHDTAEWPRWNLPSTLYHEALPGHQLQGGFAFEAKGLPRLRQNLYFAGYSEGWALYAEQLADELGMYEHDPIGRIGWLKEQLFRAGRLVVDTGMHHLGWSREKAIETLMALDGDAIGSTTREVDRYVAVPGQACSYMLGFIEWNRLRDKARAALGPRFDIKAFHDAGLNAGTMPLTVLDRAIDDYIGSAKARA